LFSARLFFVHRRKTSFATETNYRITQKLGQDHTPEITPDVSGCASGELDKGIDFAESTLWRETGKH